MLCMKHQSSAPFIPLYPARGHQTQEEIRVTMSNQNGHIGDSEPAVLNAAVLQVILEQTRMVLEAEAVSLQLCDAARNVSVMTLAAGECQSCGHCIRGGGDSHFTLSPAGIPVACISFLAQEGLVGSVCICRAESFDTAALHILSAMGMIAASAVYDCQRFRREQEEICDGSLEGWVQALELRNKETREHTRRVTAMTIELARAYGLNDTELVHVHRGALLHDIGKLAIPDSILLKPGALAEDEWQLMREHPRYAYEMLKSIPFLRQSLDIPYAHHEKWDGSGYPIGLRETQIPLAARIFAVIDVWDALRSDRPYRKAWSDTQTREHIASLSGSHFDPTIVPLFFQQLNEKSSIFSQTG